jgi:hypothetical protein
MFQGVNPSSGHLLRTWPPTSSEKLPYGFAAEVRSLYVVLCAATFRLYFPNMDLT